MLLNVDKIHHKDSKNFFLIAGPCAIENEETPFEIAEKILELSNKFKIPYIFKGSFKKANRSRVDSFTGIGDEIALNIIKKSVINTISLQLRISTRYNMPNLPANM